VSVAGSLDIRAGSENGNMGKFSVQRYLAELERAEALELAQMLRRPSSEETAVLQEHLGEEKFKRMRRMAQTTMARVEATKPKGNVVNGIKFS